MLQHELTLNHAGIYTSLWASWFLFMNGTFVPFINIKTLKCTLNYNTPVKSWTGKKNFSERISNTSRFYIFNGIYIYSFQLWFCNVHLMYWCAFLLNNLMPNIFWRSADMFVWYPVKNWFATYFKNPQWRRWCRHFEHQTNLPLHRKKHNILQRPWKDIR